MPKPAKIGLRYIEVVISYARETKTSRKEIESSFFYFICEFNVFMPQMRFCKNNNVFNINEYEESIIDTSFIVERFK